MRLLLVMLAMLQAASSLPAQKKIVPQIIPSDSLDSYVERQMAERRIPGLALAIARDGRILTAKGYGFADVQNEARVKVDTRFELASLTKQFTAVGIALLVEDGKLSFDAPIATYLPDIPDAWRPITVRHLLTHTSGLPGLSDGFSGFGGASPVNISTAQMYDAARSDTLRFRPGERYLYSDVGYFLLGMITEKASGLRWRDFVQKRLFDPLAMTETYVLDQRRIHRNEARGYTIRDGELSNIRRVRQIETPSHFGIFSNLHDLVKWDAALSTDRLLSARSRELMWTPVQLNNGTTHPYGFGWEVWHQRGHAIQRHTGVTGTEIVRLPDVALVVIVLTNLGGQGPGINPWGIAREIAEMLVPALKRPALIATPIAEADLRRFTGDYVSEGRQARVSAENGQLHLAAPAFGQIQLVYQGGVTFEVKNVDRQLVFDVEGLGVASGFTLVTPGPSPPLHFIRAERRD